MPYTITLLNPTDISNLADCEKIPPPHITGTCQKCGRCCAYYNCPALDSTSKLCKIYPNRPVVCRQWPLTNDHIALADCKGYHIENEN